MTMRRKRGRPRHDDVLTPAEWQVTHAVQHGLSNREIAERKGISRNGIKYHVANVLSKLHVRDRKALRLWFHKPKHSAPGSKGTAIMATVTLNSIGQIARQVQDINQAIHWYGDTLGLPHLYSFGDMAFFDCHGTRLLLKQAADPSPGDSIIYFLVDDIGQAYEELTRKGVEFISGPHMIHKHGDGTEEWMGFFKDVEGRPLAIMSKVVPQPSPLTG
jgi:DNA-binding CsgD family transcriptional regulator/catechol 2,3-dioxygenase-like lactoylglutathione lyase family enzyme